jgi:hypothetical protein
MQVQTGTKKYCFLDLGFHFPWSGFLLGDPSTSYLESILLTAPWRKPTLLQSLIVEFVHRQDRQAGVAKAVHLLLQLVLQQREASNL